MSTNHPQTPQALQEAAQITRATLPLAARLKLPVNPINFAVLYEHIAGTNPALSEEFQKIQNNMDMLTKDRITTLYESFINQNDEKAIEKLRDALLGIVVSTRGSLDKVQTDSQSYQDYLGNAAEGLLNTPDPKHLTTIIHDLIDHTFDMHKKSQGLQDALSSANSDLDALREEFQRVKQETLIDPLTQVKNRRAFDNSLKDAIALARKTNSPLSLLLIDVDHFKKINDEHGHAVGDAVLKWITKTISRVIRGEDSLARYGGEEFVIILPDTKEQGGVRVGENIREKLSASSLKLREKSLGDVTVSIGLAQLDTDDTEEHFFARVDKALYDAKKSGRNCLRVNRC